MSQFTAQFPRTDLAANNMSVPLSLVPVPVDDGEIPGGGPEGGTGLLSALGLPYAYNPVEAIPERPDLSILVGQAAVSPLSTVAGPVDNDDLPGGAPAGGIGFLNALGLDYVYAPVDAMTVRPDLTDYVMSMPLEAAAI